MAKLKIGQLVWQFAKELKDHISGGMEYVDPITYKDRISKCNECPNLTEGHACALCGCFMPVKARWATSKCPDTPAKWNRHGKKDNTDTGDKA